MANDEAHKHQYTEIVPTDGQWPCSACGKPIPVWDFYTIEWECELCNWKYVVRTACSEECLKVVCG
jgi:hypothetical protein